jgi:hypothetical protein
MAYAAGINLQTKKQKTNPTNANIAQTKGTATLHANANHQPNLH